MDIIREFLDGDGPCANFFEPLVIGSTKNRFTRERRCTGTEKAFVARGVREEGRRELRRKSKEGGSGGGRRNAYHWLQPHRPSDPYLWSPSGVGVAYTPPILPPRASRYRTNSLYFRSPLPPLFPPRKSKLNLGRPRYTE